MGERKVLNKYYPPDFDPAKIPRRKRPRNEQIKVRMMLPMSIRCNTCGNYIYKGTKFNSRKEDCEGETYLGIQIFRFYFKCSRCSAELTMKTDPQNSDYIMESGASRNFEPWRATDEAMDEAVKQKNTEEMGDAMKALENRTIESKQEMDILAALDEMKSMRARHAMVGVEDMMQALRRTAEVKEKELAEADEAVLRSVVFQNSQNFVRRLDDNDLEDEYMVDIDSNEDSKGKGSGLKSTDLGGRSTAQVVDTLVSHVPEHRAKGLLETGSGSQGVTKPHVPVFAVKAKKVQSSEKVVQLKQVVQEMAQAKNPMGLPLDYSSDNDDEESPGESTRTSNISKVQSSEKVVQPTQVVQEMARAKNPMGLPLDYSSDDDDEECPGESTRSSDISKVITVHDLNPQCTSTNPDLVVIFCHGIGYGKNDEWKETWTSTTSDGKRVCWPEEWLPADLATENVNKVRILSLSYDSVLGPNEDVRDIRRNLVQSLVSKSEYEPLWEAPIVLVGYSFGGLMVKSLVVEVDCCVNHPWDRHEHRHQHTQQTCTKFWENLKATIFYGVPHMDVAYPGGEKDFIEFFAWECQQFNDANKKQIAKSGYLTDIKSFNLQMAQLSIDFETAVDPTLIIYAFGEGRPVRRGESVLVPFYSARYLAPTNHYMVEDATHITICQPTSQQAINYSLLKHVLAVVVEGTQGRTTPQSKHALSQQRFLNTPSQISSSSNTTVDLDNMDISFLVSFEPEHGLPCSQQNPMDRPLDYSSDDDDEESPGESTRSSYISKVITVHDLNPQCTSTNPDLVVIFCHGIGYGKNDEWKETWTSTTSDGKRVCWPEEWLPADLATENVNKVRILSLSYDSVLGPNEDVRDIRRNLVQSLVSKSEYEPLWEAPIVLVGYSFGGLMVKSLVVEVFECLRYHGMNFCERYGHTQQSCTKFGNNLKGTVFYGVPHMDVAYPGGEKDFIEFFAWECQQFNDANKKQIAKSGYLEDIESFNRRMTQLSYLFKSFEVAQAFIIYSFYEERPIRKGESVLVPYVSGQFLAPRYDIVVEDATHITICQPTSQQAINYSLLKHFCSTTRQSKHDLRRQRFLNTRSRRSSSSNLW